MSSAASFALVVGTAPRISVAAPSPVADDGRHPATVLGLEADEAGQGDALTAALRDELAARGWSGGDTLGLVELRLALGCENNAPACLAEGGKTLRSQRLVFGTLSPAPQGQLEVALSVLDVDEATVSQQGRWVLEADALDGSRVDDTAKRLVDELLPQLRPEKKPAVTAEPEQAAAAPAPTPAVVAQPPLRQDSASPSDDSQRSRLQWGYRPPIPPWKWAGLGVGAAATLTGLAGTIGTTVTLQRLNDDLLVAANESLQDCVTAEGGVEPCGPDETDFFTGNDVDPALVNDICVAGSEMIGTTQGGASVVRNRRIFDICERAQTLERANIGFLVVGAVGLATTAVFTALLFTHRDRRASAANERSIRVGGGPSADGGWMVHGSMRF